MSKSLNKYKISNLQWEELLWISRTKRNFWSAETKRLAKTELDKRKISNYEKDQLWDTITEELEISFEEDFFKNGTEGINIGYSNYQKFKIFITAPFTLARLHPIGDLIALFKEKKMKMFWEKLILIALGTIFWVSVFLISWNHSEKERLREIQDYELNE